MDGKSGLRVSIAPFDASRTERAVAFVAGERAYIA
jgi:hypothetical protein